MAAVYREASWCSLVVGPAFLSFHVKCHSRIAMKWVKKLFGWFARLITAHESERIHEDRLALKDDQIKKLEAKIRDMETARDKEQFEADQITFHKGIEFRRGIKTAGKWMGFCPKCHLPAEDAWRQGCKEKVVICTGRCGWKVIMKQQLQDLTGEIEI